VYVALLLSYFFQANSPRRDCFYFLPRLVPVAESRQELSRDFPKKFFAKTEMIKCKEIFISEVPIAK
jgi:hypothetical protein